MTPSVRSDLQAMSFLFFGCSLVISPSVRDVSAALIDPFDVSLSGDDPPDYKSSAEENSKAR